MHGSTGGDWKRAEHAAPRQSPTLHPAGLGLLWRVLSDMGQRPEAAGAEKGLRELVSSKADVEYGVTIIAAVKAEALVRRSRRLVDLAGPRECCPWVA